MHLSLCGNLFLSVVDKAQIMEPCFLVMKPDSAVEQLYDLDKLLIQLMDKAESHRPCFIGLLQLLHDLVCRTMYRLSNVRV